ncbi:hypothetical protein BDZ89DRAFT_1056538 [Hymenopellis radicata]|nr:hypothetical protein BDZ89DRAFT_1056538 [Hymenopellis radicata]
MSPNIKLSRSYTSYKSSPSQETLGIIGGVLPDGRPRSSNPRYMIYTAPDLIGLVPSFNDKERIMSCILVPQPRLPETGPLTMPSISFAPDSELQVEGVPLSDCLARQGMRDLDKAAFKEEMDEVHFLLCWPGYEHYEWLITIPTTTSQGDVISRGELAEIIAGQYEEFIQRCLNGTLHCTDPNWLIGPGLMGSTFDEMYLCSFWTPGDGFWRASMSVKKDITDEWYFAKERREREESQSTSGDQGRRKGKKRTRRDNQEEEEPESGPHGWQPSATGDSLVDQLFGLDEE